MPDDTSFATKPRLAARMIERAMTTGVPFRWVAADTVYGVGEVEQPLRRDNKGYVLGVKAAHVFNAWNKPHMVGGTAAEITMTRQASEWQRLSAGAGTKGPRWYDWCYLELADLELADLDASEFNADATGTWTRGLLIR